MKKFLILVLFFCFLSSFSSVFVSTLFAFTTPDLTESIPLGDDWKIASETSFGWTIAPTQNRIEAAGLNESITDRFISDYNVAFAYPSWNRLMNDSHYDPFDPAYETIGFLFTNLPDADLLINCRPLDINFNPTAASNDSNTVPEPATMLLLGIGLIFLAGLERKFRKK